MSSVIIGTGVSLLLSLCVFVDTAMKYMHVHLHPPSVSVFQLVYLKAKSSQWFFLSLISPI